MFGEFPPRRARPVDRTPDDLKFCCCGPAAIPIASLVLAGASQVYSTNKQEKAQNAALDQQRTAFDASQKTLADANKALADTAEAKARTGQDLAAAAGTGTNNLGFQNQGSTLLTGYQGVTDPLSLSAKRLYGGNKAAQTQLLGA
jgi:hypothetical protein